jgi:hypothetical protein
MIFHAPLLIEVRVTDQSSSRISRGRCTSLHTGISLTSTGVRAWDGSVTCDVSVNRSNARRDRDEELFRHSNILPLDIDLFRKHLHWLLRIGTAYHNTIDLFEVIK